MLEEINITNLGIIKQAELSFTAGLTVLTGETGAGKTMVLSALNLLLGKRANSSMVKQDMKQLSVEGCWNLNNENGLQLLEEIEGTGAVIEDGQLYINRTVKSDGKSRAVVGGKTTPTKILETFGNKLVNIHGQSEQVRLRNPNAQREALDRYAGTKLETASKKYSESFKKWREQQKLIADVKENATKRKREISLLKKFVQDFDKISPTIDEDVEISEKISSLSNLDEIRSKLSEAYEYLSPTNDELPAVSDQIHSMLKSLGKISGMNSDLEKLHQEANALSDMLYDVETSLETALQNLDEDNVLQLHEAQTREAELKQIVRKYGTDLNDVIAQRNKAETELEELQKYTQPVDELEEELLKLEKDLIKQAAVVTKLRVTAAALLEKAVNKELKGLSMSGSVFKIVITAVNPTSSGVDEIDFGLSMNGSSKVNPIAKTASGGELSRIMLSLEVVLADTKNTATFVFDEVDSGVGGETAIEIGKRLSQLSKEAQVIVVTHLPQVAAYADNHLKVSKTVESLQVETTVETLDEKGRVDELTRMLSGLSDSVSGKAHAKDLLEHAEVFKNS